MQEPLFFATEKSNQIHSAQTERTQLEVPPNQVLSLQFPLCSIYSYARPLISFKVILS
jgi:hypothetical protein